jgi:hypothetical protein
MNVEIGTEAAQFPEKEYINGIFLAVQTLTVGAWLGASAGAIEAHSPKKQQYLKVKH